MITEDFINLTSTAIGLYIQSIGEENKATFAGYIAWLCHHGGEQLIYKGSIPAPAPEKEKKP